MRMTRTSFIVISSLISFVVTLPAFAQTTDVAVVVNTKNPVTNLTLPELRKIMRGEKHAWNGGKPIVIIVRGSDCHERTTLLDLMKMSETDYKAYWRSQVFRGEATTEPVAVPSNGMQREALALYPGGIALVESQDVKPGMKVISLEGHMPGESQYPLK